MVRSCLEDQQFAEQMKSLKQRWFDQTEEGQIQKLVSQHKVELRDVNKDFTKTKTLYALRLVVDHMLKDPPQDFIKVASSWIDAWDDKFNAKVVLVRGPIDMCTVFPPARMLSIRWNNRLKFLFAELA